MRVLIVGAGVIGLSSAWALARAGHEPVVFEQGPIPNPVSASFDQHRMIRFHYGDQAGYTRMVGQAYAAWETLWADLGARHAAETGVLAVSTAPGDWTDASKASFAALGTPHRVLEAQEVHELCPQLRLPAGAWGLLTEGGGVLLADRIVSGLARHLRDRGVALNRDARVTGLDPDAATVTLADGRQVSGDAVVMAAGAWIDKLRPGFAGAMRSIRSVVSYVAPPGRFADAWARGPALFITTDGNQLYGLPPVGGCGLKFGGAPLLAPGDPDAPPRVTDDEAQRVLASFAPFLVAPEAYGTLESIACCYADNGVKQFVVERTGKTLVVGNCGGRMFKFGALMGLEVAEAVTAGRDAAELAAWAAGTLAGDRPLTAGH